MFENSPQGRQPAFNVPQIILIILALLISIHVIRSLVLPERTDFDVLLKLSFIPARYFGNADVIPGGMGAMAWSPITYSLLHANFQHLIINCLWLLVFGSAVARRFGTERFVLLSAAAAAGGALLHLISYPNDIVPLVGASAAISGHTAAAARFVFEPGGPMGPMRHPGAWYNPAPPLRLLMRNRMVLFFVGIWFALNLLTGLGSFAVEGGGSTIAWQAHVGGFLVGLFLFPYLDPVGGSGPKPPVAKRDPNLSKFKVIQGDREEDNNKRH